MSKIDELLTRAVSEVMPMDLAKKKLSGEKKLRVYLGIDPTGSKLHLGHAVVLRKLRAFQDAGHEVIFLIGSFTAMIGDPSGRDVQREPLTKEDVMKNFKTYKEQAGKILDFSKMKIAYNHEWLEKMQFQDILKIASHFTMQQMSQRDMFRDRSKRGEEVSMTEFLYPMMVGYDSVMLDVDCEIGGNDQLFNMLCGRKLQEVFGKREKFVLTTKLLEGTDGRKMSKTYDNCIWLEDSAKDMFGKTMRIKDDLIFTYMECCTDIPMEEIDAAKKAIKKGSNPKEFKAQLAKEIVKMYHGAKAADEAAKEFETIFSDKGVPENMPEVKMEKGSSLLDVMVSENLVPSKSEARRLIEQGAVTLNDEKVTSFEAKEAKGILKVGKRKFIRII